jgi:hypothetical protein
MFFFGVKQIILLASKLFPDTNGCIKSSRLIEMEIEFEFKCILWVGISGKTKVFDTNIQHKSLIIFQYTVVKLQLSIRSLLGANFFYNNFLPILSFVANLTM